MRILTLLSLLAVTFALAACNTFIGVGKDLQDSGRVIQDVAR